MGIWPSRLGESRIWDIKLLVVSLKGLSPRRSDWRLKASRKVTLIHIHIIVSVRVEEVGKAYVLGNERGLCIFNVPKPQHQASFFLSFFVNPPSGGSPIHASNSCC
jgi:hypothetical protein